MSLRFAFIICFVDIGSKIHAIRIHQTAFDAKRSEVHLPSQSTEGVPPHEDQQSSVPTSTPSTRTQQSIPDDSLDIVREKSTAAQVEKDRVEEERLTKFIKDKEAVHTWHRNDQHIQSHSTVLSGAVGMSVTLVGSAKNFIGKLLAITLMVFCVSMDDVMWLMPFFVHRDEPKKIHFAILYLVCQEILVLIALGIGLGEEEVVKSVVNHFGHGTLSTEFYIRIICTIFLNIYTFKVATEWYWNNTEDDACESAEEDKPTPTHRTTGTQTQLSSRQLEIRDACLLTYRDLFLTAMLGSVDNICVYSSQVASGTLPTAPTMIGSIFASFAILAITTLLSRVSFVAKAFAALPFWCILVVTTGFMYARTFRDL
eukprot:gnl/TRDRNA2_/TRDRNA2_83948_c0_seq1.p1 gnl/TRDRNA2_/TRDRNA2_83948_c0~~gnl/TRDRNA2_/TRDRNA2_83948_c0_seq1.p1  ORF type:complete len:370 (+),score=36.10 gnl/TRDRNA2_/TRDRNA2_83948_c0_seq1:84-1193(+)